MYASHILNYNPNEFWDIPYENMDFNSVYRWHLSSKLFGFFFIKTKNCWF